MKRMQISRKKKGSVLLIVAVGLVALMGLAALVVDLGAVYTAKTQLQAGADAAALAAVHDLRAGGHTETAAFYASQNQVFRQPIGLSQSDIVTGRFDFATGEFVAGQTHPNALKVRARRTNDSTNGPFELFFAKVLGINSVELVADSTAALDNRVYGVNPSGAHPLLPFTVHVNDVGHLEYLDGTPVDAVSFEIDSESGEITVHERVDLRFQVLSTSVTFGTAPQKVPLFAWVSLDNGSSYIEMNNAEAVSPGDTLYFTDVDDPSKLVVKGRAYLRERENNTWVTKIDRTVESNTGSPRVTVLRRGDIAPDIPAFNAGLNKQVAPYLSLEREVMIGYNDVMFLYEFSPNMNHNVDDYQDLVVVCTFTRSKTVQQELEYSNIRFVPNVGETVDFFPESDMNTPGNFGTVSLDAVSNSTAVLCKYINEGYDKPFTIPTDTGYLWVNGDPGISNGIRGAVENRIGDTVLILAYDVVYGQGNNTYYRVPYLIALELVAMELNGALADRYIRGVIKEVWDSNLITGPGAPEHMAMGKLRMAQ